MINENQIKETLNLLTIENSHSKNQELEFELWEIKNIDEINKSYNVNEFIPGYFGIGSNGGDEMLTVELLTGEIYSIPFIPMDSEEKVFIAKSIDKLFK
jgi:hypothetical protein